MSSRLPKLRLHGTGENRVKVAILIQLWYPILGNTAKPTKCLVESWGIRHRLPSCHLKTTQVLYFAHTMPCTRRSDFMIHDIYFRQPKWTFTTWPFCLILLTLKLFAFPRVNAAGRLRQSSVADLGDFNIEIDVDSRNTFIIILIILGPKINRRGWLGKYVAVEHW